MSTENPCSKRVYSGNRWDFGGHMCRNKAAVERHGKWWCKRHDPEAEKAREERERAKWRAEDERKKSIFRSAESLVEKLGVGTPAWSSITREHTGGVTLTAEEAASLADRLDSLRENA